MYRKIIYIYLTAAAVFALYPCLTLSDIRQTDVTHISVKEYDSVLEVNGTIEAANTVPISLSYPVYIKECYVKENEYVNKGQLLFTLDTEKMINTIKSNNLTEYTQAYNILDKNNLYELSDKIYASDSGIVSKIAAGSGSLVFSDENLCEIQTDTDSILKITLNQEDYQNISVGDTVEFSPLIMPSSKYYGHISSKTATVRRETSLTGTKNVIDVYADIINGDDNIVNGLQFSGKILDDENKIFTALPYEYINQDENGEFVYILNGCSSDKIYIETGLETAEYTEIKTIFDPNTLFIKNNYDGKADIIIKYDME